VAYRDLLAWYFRRDAHQVATTQRITPKPTPRGLSTAFDQGYTPLAHSPARARRAAQALAGVGRGG